MFFNAISRNVNITLLYITNVLLMLHVLKREVFIRGVGAGVGWGPWPPLSKFSGSASETYKEWLKMARMEMDCDMDFWKSVRTSVFQRFKFGLNIIEILQNWTFFKKLLLIVRANNIEFLLHKFRDYSWIYNSLKTVTVFLENLMLVVKSAVNHVETDITVRQTPPSAEYDCLSGLK